MKILVSGAGGLVGTRFVQYARTLGCEVLSLTRGTPGPGLVRWDPVHGVIDPTALEGCEAVLHLAGENIASGRWTKERKRLIIESRVRGTGLLSHALASLRYPPKVLVCASGSNYYADNEGGEPWDESGPAGTGFLSEVCLRWEGAAGPAREAGIRVVHARFGVVLSTRGGLLPKLLPAVCSGLGGVAGSGKQRLSWVHIDDLAAALMLLMEDERLLGPVNVCSPQPVSNRDFIKAVAAAVHRPCFVTMPGAAIRWLFGEMGEALLLADNAVLPAKLAKAGMKWEHSEIADALEDLLAHCGCRGLHSGM